MAMRLPKTFPEQVSKSTKAVKCKPYLEWIRSLPCVITGSMPVDPAHVSYACQEYGHMGRGKSQKASDRWALPLCRPKHDEQHRMNEKAFWVSHNIDPHRLCLVLWGLYNERGNDGIPEATKIIIGKQSGGIAKQFKETT